MPQISIIVPAFNARDTLPETLKSLTAQTLTDLEIIVVNDGSIDDTAKIAEEWARKDPRIQLISQPNRGLAGARNTGISHARAPYIGLCDADDLWMPNKAATHVEHLNNAPHVGVSYSGSLLINEDGELLKQAQRPRLNDITNEHIFKRNPIGNGSAPVFRRAALKAIAWRPRFENIRDWVFDETFRQSEDIECWMRLALSTDWAFEGVPGLLTAYRINQGGLSANTNAQLSSWERMVDTLRPRDPEFFAAHEDAARAYQLRYLARRAVSDFDGDRAWEYLRKSMAASSRPLLEEPVKTLVTTVAAGLFYLIGPRYLNRLILFRDRKNS